MSRKTWIKLKRGLSEDPKHRGKMGMRVWAFIHMIDRADWETGIVHDWKDQDEADAMGVGVNTMRDWRQGLEAANYISCRQTQHGQDITIFKWVNPREYTGKVYNVPPISGEEPESQGDEKPSPSENEGDVQGDYQVRGKDVTPTLYSDSDPIDKEKETYLNIIRAQAPAYWDAHNSNAWKRIEAILSDADFIRVDGVLTVRGVGEKAAEYQDRYARIFERMLVGGLNEKVSVVFEA